jgi:hypothetical protein
MILYKYTVEVFNKETGWITEVRYYASSNINEIVDSKDHKYRRNFTFTGESKVF